jgi:hypothetical protein
MGYVCLADGVRLKKGSKASLYGGKVKAREQKAVKVVGV